MLNPPITLPGKPEQITLLQFLDNGVKRRDARSLHVVTVYIAFSLTELSVRDYHIPPIVRRSCRWLLAVANTRLVGIPFDMLFSFKNLSGHEAS